MIYHVFVKPGSSKDEIAKTEDGLIIRTHKKAHDGEANTAVIELLSDYLDIPKTRISIKSGTTSRYKTVEII
ncbi:DUF167 domain-containing protein [Candidatus Saccharibacteria bacterium]|nr:DUF167 domain-containing protein [Candidatus Saccharibacteria bacterium]